ncbi:MAG: hypothetical protein JF597_00705 [Streptomyces sp.]|uniref:hypothetical protein n=1 Tax=Streptomyces sp. TaxID=1931 RepID=UPI0025F8D115|nr:hypothetical protein [Streptomyces sp.]MBW8792158.1 hypothetical protein [Streptomyces sp.]
MRVRIHTTAGDLIDCEQYSPDNGTTWLDITVAQVVAAMGAETGYTVVRDVLTGAWRAFRNARIESIGPAGDLSEVIQAEVERRIQVLLAEQLPKRVKEVVDNGPSAGGLPGSASSRNQHAGTKP